MNLIAATEPAFTALLAYLLLGEFVSQTQIRGGLLIFGSIFTLRFGETGYRISMRLGRPSEPVPAPATSAFSFPEK